MSGPDPNIQMQMFSTKSELLDWLAKKSYVLLGFNSETPREFFGIQVCLSNQEFRIGIGSFGVGIKPAFVAVNGTLYVGFNDRVATFSMSLLRFEQEIALLSIFWQFLPSLVVDIVLVLCETALVAVSQGRIRWRVDTDVVKTFGLVGDSIALTFLDDPPMRLDLRSGQHGEVDHHPVAS